ncbi:hypothetical protein AHP24_41 [Escherichia phage bV_EcoS_AHP24]|uniref:Uncharacterized protein n=2 Tax=Escherichia phage vB_EcoS_AHS24 TaxID=1416030 RepID=A0A067YYT6_9CAUD|nr:hypothetical protein LA65_gp43 [Escherichia phage vB_EcoS_AHS24]AHI60509.1 hypothetical protein AHP24_41 [Escherichia phage bV_EcoS_AHP24]AHI60665.1 hypothetical protein AHS24_43 [Escherichia phage vB_EcoS_AHS24]
MITANCVMTNGSFTLLNEYEFKLDPINDQVEIVSDDGFAWKLHNEFDGYYGCNDAKGKHVSFLVYE